MTNRAGLLPGRIPPQTLPLVTQLADGRLVADINWYLYFYNLGQQVLAGSTGTVNYTPADLIAIQDDDVVSTDTANISRRITDVALQLQDPDAAVTQREVMNALLLALDTLPQDPQKTTPPPSVAYTGNSSGDYALGGTFAAIGPYTASLLASVGETIEIELTGAVLGAAAAAATYASFAFFINGVDLGIYAQSFMPALPSNAPEAAVVFRARRVVVASDLSAGSFTVVPNAKVVSGTASFINSNSFVGMLTLKKV